MLKFSAALPTWCPYRFVARMTLNDYVMVVSCSGRCEAEACSESEKLQRQPPTVKR